MMPHGSFRTFIDTVTLCVPMALITLCSIFSFFGHAHVLSHLAMDGILIFFLPYIFVQLFSMVSRFFTLGMEFGIIIFSFILLPEVDVEEVGNLHAVAPVTCHRSNVLYLPKMILWFFLDSFLSSPPRIRYRCGPALRWGS